MRDFLDYYFSPRRFIGDVRSAALVRDRGNARSFDFTPNYVTGQPPFRVSFESAGRLVLAKVSTFGIPVLMIEIKAMSGKMILIKIKLSNEG